MSSRPPPPPDWLRELKAALPTDRVVTDPDVVAAHSRDQAAFVTAGTAACLVRARTRDDVVTTLRIADAHRVPVVTRGAGTGLAGGANALDHGIVLSVAAMDRIVAVDAGTRTAVVEPGVLNADLVAAAAGHGLTYAPDPASREISTLGGNIATNAGGACCLKYGVTRDHVAGLRVVLADGTLISTGSVTAKDVAGLDLTSLVVGSEGTLGVVVEATLRLRPRGAPPATLAASFRTTAEAGAATVAMLDVASPSMLELMDHTTLGAVEAHTRMDLDTTAGALLVVRSDGPDAGGDIARCAAACEAAGATLVASTDDPDEGELLWHARRLAYPALEHLGTTLLDDVAVPVPAIPRLLADIEAIAARHDVLIGTFGHAGDGNLHPTLVFDPADAASVAAARAAFAEVIAAALALGGTISGEHGIGTLKHAFLADQLGPAERALTARIRAAFDPNGILNPGKAT